MTHFQELFIKNLRFLRKKRGISQLRFSEMIDISPNYLNAVENGKHFPSPEVIQQISDTLAVPFYQLFLEYPMETAPARPDNAIQELVQVKARVIKELDNLIQKYEHRTME
jgi:transcriptional regulator with XRE-family HTH domain